MPSFRFTAAAALELRRRQEDEAAGALARVEAELRRFGDARAAAEAAHASAQAEAQAAGRTGSEVAALEWHRNWIFRLAGDVMQAHQNLARQTQVVMAAERAWREARQRRLALERMRARALQRFEHHEAREEMKANDELARLRYLTAAAERAGDQS